MEYADMHLKILLPYRVFLDEEGVKRVVAETQHGSFGLLPNRLDGVAGLVPGILTFESAGSAESFIAIDEGILVKIGDQVLVSVRNAIGGADLGKLHKVLEEEFRKTGQEELDLRTNLAKLESNFIRRMAQLKQ